MISILTWKKSDNKTANINVKKRFNASVTMTLSHYTMSEDDDSVMMPWNFSMWKYYKRIFGVFYVLLVSSLH